MKSLLRKVAKAYAKATTNTSFMWIWHTTTAPRTLIKK